LGCIFFCLVEVHSVVPEGCGVGNAVDGDHGGPGCAASWRASQDCSGEGRGGVSQLASTVGNVLVNWLCEATF
jgi:hypothetical protein